MSEIANEQPTDENPLPAPPEENIDPDRIAGAEERWVECPLRDCKRDPELLYADFYLRDIRTNRLMCNACAVKTEVGYLAREVVKASDDRFYTGNIGTDAIVFGVMLAGSIVGNAAALFIGSIAGFFAIYIAFLVGGAIGGGLAMQARRLSGRKVTRQSHYFGIGGIVVGALLTPTVFFFFRYGFVVFDIGLAFNLSTIACSVGMIMAAWGVFLRRI